MGTRKNDLTCIKRVDDDRRAYHGWEVAIQRRGKKHFKTFSDGVHGGKQQALSKAKAFRDDIVAANKTYNVSEFADKVSGGRSNTGVTGVCRYRLQRKNKWVVVYEAYWPIAPGKRKTLRFSADQHGDAQAFELAIAARKKGMEETRGRAMRRLDGKPREHNKQGTKQEKRIDPRIRRVRLNNYSLSLELWDDRKLSAPLYWFPKLKSASAEQRQHWKLMQHQKGVRWSDIGFVVKVNDMLQMPA